MPLSNIDTGVSQHAGRDRVPQPLLAPAQSIDPREIVRSLRRHFKLILAVPLVFVLLALAFIAIVTPLYTATSTIMIDPRRAVAADPTGHAQPNVATDDATIESQVSLVQSLGVLQRVVDALKLTEDPEFAPRPGVLSSIRSLFSSSVRPDAGNAAEVARTKSVDALRRRLKIARQRSTFLVDIGASSVEPVKAATIANEIANAYFTELVRSKYDATKIASGWLNRQIDDLKARVIASDKAVQDFRAANNLVAAQGVTVNDQQISDINNRLIEARVQTAEARAKYEQAQAMTAKRGGDPGAVAEALSSDIIARLRGQYAELTKNESDLSTKYGVRHPLVSAVRAQLRQTRSLIDEEIRRIMQSRRHTFEVAAAREESLQKSLDELQGVSTGSAGAQVRLRELQREADANRTLYESFLARYKEASAQESLELPESRVVARAEPPLQPSFPRVALTLALAIIVGGGLGGLLALGADYVDQRIKSLDQAKAVSGLPAIAAIPKIDVRELASLAKRGRNELDHYDPKASRLLPGPLQPPLMRYAIEQPASLFAESVRAVRVEIQRAVRARRAQVVMVTSALDNEGKTTLAANIAQSFAVLGMSTALVDGDLRNPELTRSLCPRAQFGLLEASFGETALHQAMLVDPSTHLSILPSPHSEDDSQSIELVSAEGMAPVLDELRRHFDIIVVDSPPLLPLVDGRALAEQADCILLTIGWDRTSRDSLVRALDLLAPVHDRVLGTALTRVDLARMRLYNPYEGATYRTPYVYAPVSREAAE